MYFRNTWVLLTFFHSPSIKCWSPCSWGKLCAWTAAWTFPCYPLSKTALHCTGWVVGERFKCLQYSDLHCLTFNSLFFVVVKPHWWSCWQGCLQEKEEKRQEQMCSRHVWPFLSFERYNEKFSQLWKIQWEGGTLEGEANVLKTCLAFSQFCPSLNFKR